MQALHSPHARSAPTGFMTLEESLNFSFLEFSLTNNGENNSNNNSKISAKNRWEVLNKYWLLLLLLLLLLYTICGSFPSTYARYFWKPIKWSCARGHFSGIAFDYWGTVVKQGPRFNSQHYKTSKNYARSFTILFCLLCSISNLFPKIWFQWFTPDCILPASCLPVHPFISNFIFLALSFFSLDSYLIFLLAVTMKQ